MQPALFDLREIRDETRLPDVTIADVRFEPLDSADPTQAGIDHDYHAKYDRYGPRYVGAVVGEATYPTTLRVVPQAARTTA